MIPALLTGMLGFGLMLWYDFLAAFRQTHAPGLFLAGACLPAVATVWLIWLADPLSAFWARPLLFLMGAAGALACFAGMGYTLFVALPFATTYTKPGLKQCVSHGWYALCRHPSALFLYGGYGFLLLMVPSLPLLLGFLLFPTLNLAYVAVEDRWIFPRTIVGYEQYRQETPFFVPDSRVHPAHEGYERQVFS